MRPVNVITHKWQHRGLQGHSQDCRVRHSAITPPGVDWTSLKEPAGRTRVYVYLFIISTADRPSPQVARDLRGCLALTALCLRLSRAAHGAARHLIGPDHVNVFHFIYGSPTYLPLSSTLAPSHSDDARPGVAPRRPPRKCLFVGSSPKRPFTFCVMK
jgi:hypothetical protein